MNLHAGGEAEHWLSTSVNLGQLLVAMFVIIGTLISAVLYNESRVTKLEVAAQYGKARNDGQDLSIESLRNSTSQSQVLMGQIGVRLDNIQVQLGSISATLDVEYRQRTFNQEGKRR